MEIKLILRDETLEALHLSYYIETELEKFDSFQRNEIKNILEVRKNLYLSYFGIKYTPLFGWKQSNASYNNKENVKLVKDYFRAMNEIREIQRTKILLLEIHKQICNQTDVKSFSSDFDVQVELDKSWVESKLFLEGFGFEKTIEELQSIMHEIKLNLS